MPAREPVGDQLACAEQTVGLVVLVDTELLGSVYAQYQQQLLIARDATREPEDQVGPQPAGRGLIGFISDTHHRQRLTELTKQAGR